MSSPDNDNDNDDRKIREIRVPRASACLPGKGRAVFYEMNVSTDSVDVRFSDVMTTTNEREDEHKDENEKTDEEGREFRCAMDDWRIDVFARRSNARPCCIVLDRICIWNASRSIA